MTESDLRSRARASLLPNFTRGWVWRSDELPVIVRGEGCYIYDQEGRRYLDGLAGLYCVNIGHGRSDIAIAASKQMETLAYTPVWSAVHPMSVEAAELIADLAPGDLGAVFFVSSGSEAVESAMKFAREYHFRRNERGRTKFIAREWAYHGTSFGALSLTGVPGYREPFMPLLPGVLHVPNTLGAKVSDPADAGSLDCVRAIEEVIEREGAETIAAIFAEPVQNARGALVPPEGYWQALRSICDRNGILLVADEVITGFGRVGTWFASERFDVVPDVITFAKGSTSGYAPLGGIIVRRPLAETLFAERDAMFTHGATWSGHPVSTAVAVANVSALRDERVLENVATQSPRLAAGLGELRDRHACVKDLRGTGYFYAFEFMADRESGRELEPAQARVLLREVLPREMRKIGLVTRPDERGAPMLMLSPPLVADGAVIDELLEMVDALLEAADGFTHA